MTEATASRCGSVAQPWSPTSKKFPLWYISASSADGRPSRLDQRARWGCGGCSTLVTWPHFGHSDGTNPGSYPSGAMLTTSLIVAPHRSHSGPVPYFLSDTDLSLQRRSLGANARFAG